jgi:hypothetical protein
VVAVGAMALFALFALDAENPIGAGIAIACLFNTRPHTLLVGVFFVFEAIRVTASGGVVGEGTIVERIRKTWDRVDKSALQKKLIPFAAPIAVGLLLASFYNHARFHTWSPNAFGHEYLTVVWKDRMARWGLFGLHYLPKNLGVFLTILPWLPPKGTPGVAPFQVNEHGLAIWFTMPFYLLLLWPKRWSYLYVTLMLAALGPLVFLLFYQNSGWRQFGYRFSNDYAIMLFLGIAASGRRFGKRFWIAAAWAILWNTFGAISFDRGPPWDKYYWREGTQKILYQDD